MGICIGGMRRRLLLKKRLPVAPRALIIEKDMLIVMLASGGFVTLQLFTNRQVSSLENLTLSGVHDQFSRRPNPGGFTKAALQGRLPQELIASYFPEEEERFL